MVSFQCVLNVYHMAGEDDINEQFTYLIMPCTIYNVTRNILGVSMIFENLNFAPIDSETRVLISIRLVSF